MDAGRRAALGKLAETLNVRFNDLTLLHEALVHSSYANEHGGVNHNERLEFLGDAVVGLVISHRLFTNYAKATEGELTRAKALLVSAASMADIGYRLQVDSLLLLGRGERRSGGRGRSNMVANAVEAIIGAVFLDQPWDVTVNAVLTLWDELDDPELVRGDGAVDSKSALQEYWQGRGDGTPTYRIKHSYGPDHDKTFVCQVMLGDRLLASGTGHSKREAEQDAASKALKQHMGQ